MAKTAGDAERKVTAWLLLVVPYVVTFFVPLAG
jgi:hypothetical protein